MQIVITQEFSNIKASRSSTGPTKTKKKKQLLLFNVMAEIL